MSSIWNAAAALVQGLWRKTTAWQRSARLTADRRPLHWPHGALETILNRWDNPGHPPCTALDRTTANPLENDTVERVRKETDVWNLNNVTRTQAYWNMYTEFPEIHWALLAHLVSRNGGWSMTDLKGEWLPKLLAPEDAADHFDMLETCNALIFRDAYPQLKLYAESRRIGRPLFHLLPSFGVSSFMSPFWDVFWDERESALLTVALIVNEQHVIQQPVVENRRFRDRVFASPSFRSLAVMQTNQIVFPLQDGLKRKHEAPPLAGRVLENFENLEERIGFGKCLYGLLFAYPRVHDGAVAFARFVPHTGSRADYWPGRFSADKRKTGADPRSGDSTAGNRWYSPKLEDAWPDRPLHAGAAQDWFTDRSALAYVSPPKPPQIVDMTYEHLLGMRKWQTAAAVVSGNF